MKNRVIGKFVVPFLVVLLVACAPTASPYKPLPEVTAEPISAFQTMATATPVPVAPTANESGAQLAYTPESLEELSRTQVVAPAIALYVSPEGRPMTQSGKTVTNVFMPQVMYWESNIVNWADKYVIADPDIIAIVMQLVSCGSVYKYSGDMYGYGRIGLFQVPTSPVLGNFYEDTHPLYDVEANAENALPRLSDAYHQTNLLSLVIASFDTDPSIMGADYSAWPNETKRLVDWALYLHDDIKNPAYQNIVNPATELPTLFSWLQAGGQRFCDAAAAQQGITP